jgi:4-amino-4-deoxy-L-arabinose transferase-like glycosyltransferase
VALAAVVAAVVRAVNILVVRPSCLEDVVASVERDGPTFNPSQCPSGEFAIWGDSLYGHLQGRMLARGHGFVDGATWFVSGGETYRTSAGDPPLYASFLGLLSRIGLQSATEQRLASAAAGVVGVVLLGLVARRVAGPRAGVLAAAVAAVYPMLWINDGMLLSESLFVPMVALAVLGAYRFWDRPSTASAALFGLSIGAAALTRAEAGLLVVVPLVPLVWGLRDETVRRRLALGGVALAVVAATLAPWFAYNTARFEEPVFMTSQTGAVLSAASCDATFYGERLGYWDDCMAWYVATGRVEDWPSWDLDESQRDRVPREAALTYTRENASRLPVVMAARVARLWDLYAPRQSVEFNAVIEGRGWGPSQAGIVAYYLLLPAAVGGGVVLARRRVPLSPLLAMPFIVTVTAAGTFGITRYRAPADAVLVVLAAVGIDWLVGRRRPAPGLGTVRTRPRRDAHPGEPTPAGAVARTTDDAREDAP